MSVSSGGASAGAVLNASGYVTARRRATVSSKVTGKVLEVFVEEGKPVKKGQVLARLDDSQIRAALAVAEAQLGASRADGRRRRGAAQRSAADARPAVEQLLKDNIVGQAEVDQAEADVESIKARIALAHQQVQVAKSQVDAAADRSRPTWSSARRSTASRSPRTRSRAR